MSGTVSTEKRFTLLDKARIENGEINPGMPVSEILEGLQRNEFYVAKNLFSVPELKKMYTDVFEHFKSKEPQLKDLTWGMENHWRIDNNPPKSSIPKIQAIYFIFSWNEEFPLVRKIGGMLGRLRNKIAGLPRDYGFQKGDPYYAVPALQHYPTGGGFISRHEDPKEPQKCVVSLSLSKFGEDCQEGGLYIERNGQQELVDAFLDPGDVSIVRPDIFHGVAPIDPGKKAVDFHSIEGRWRMATILSQPY